jgi:hypothetical protein
VVLITEMLEICIQTSYDQNVQLILKSYPRVVYQILPEVYGTTLSKIWQLFLTIWTLQDKQYTYVAGENKMYLFSLRNR